jgi:hypothetical protein
VFRAGYARRDAHLSSMHFVNFFKFTDCRLLLRLVQSGMHARRSISGLLAIVSALLTSLSLYASDTSREGDAKRGARKAYAVSNSSSERESLTEVAREISKQATFDAAREATRQALRAARDATHPSMSDCHSG